MSAPTSKSLHDALAARVAQLEQQLTEVRLKQGALSTPSVQDSVSQQASGQGDYAYYANLPTQVRLIGNDFHLAPTPVNLLTGAGFQVCRDNLGYNPLMGAITGAPPTSPTSGTHYQNTTGHDLQVSITGGTVTTITVYDPTNTNGVTVGTATNASFIVPAGCYYSVTWTTRPTAAYAGL